MPRAPTPVTDENPDSGNIYETPKKSITTQEPKAPKRKKSKKTTPRSLHEAFNAATDDN